VPKRFEHTGREDRRTSHAATLRIFKVFRVESVEHLWDAGCGATRNRISQASSSFNASQHSFFDVAQRSAMPWLPQTAPPACREQRANAAPKRAGVGDDVG